MKLMVSQNAPFVPMYDAWQADSRAMLPYDEDKARRDQEQSIANAQADAAHAQSIIEQATEVHDHPEITESLAGSLARDKAEHAETEQEVTQLEATEDAVRERTRDSRIKFTGAIVCIVAAILVIIAIWLFASK